MRPIFHFPCALALSMLLCVSSAPAHAHADHGKPQYGGVVAEAGYAQFEAVARDGALIVYVTQHGVPLDTVGASGKLIVLAGTAKSEIALKPAGGNRLGGAGELPAGAKLLFQIQLPGGKPMLQARAVVR